ncbi:MAG: DUF1905 domain-containing protein [Bacteroidetes bacterium]|nr:DUF1905 domain-containing protein [Bacteroidota bacterium]
MVQFVVTIMKFAEQGEKTGWTYITIPAKIAQKLKPGNKKSFRVKGKLDDHPIKSVALLPMGAGDFIIPLNAAMRKAIRKTKGDKLNVQLEEDTNKPKPPAALLECLDDEPEALKFFKTLPLSHQNYFGNWIRSAKTEATQAKRIAQTVTALGKKFDFGQMVRSLKAQRDNFAGK